MVTKIQKWGNSLGIRIPMALLKELSLKNGSIVEIEEVDNQIIIQPSRKIELHDLLNKISEDNLHSETDWGIAEGDEIW